MKSFADEQRVMADLAVSVADYTAKYMVQEPWRWIPAGLVAVLSDAISAFNQLFWIIVTLWFSDLVLGFLKAWHREDEEIEWVKVYRSVLKLFVITISVIAMNGIEQLLQEMGLDPAGKLVLATMLVIGSADAFSIVGKMTYFWPGMAQVGEHIKAFLGRAQPSHDRRAEDEGGVVAGDAGHDER
jgi:hypothetical protein